jgi:glycosyltransferase involved in cell wall biosynthesis
MQVAGAEVLVTQIIDQLKDKIEPTIFCLDSVGKLGEELQSKGVSVVLMERRPGVDKAVPGKLAREFKSRRIQLVHAHQYTPYFYCALARLSGGWSTRILLTEHGRHYPDIVSSKRRWVNRLLLSKLAAHSTACCAFSARALEQNDGFRRVEVLYNGIDSSLHPQRKTPEQRRELRERLGLSSELVYVTCIARFHPVKDHGTLLRGFAKLHSSAPQTRLLLVGTGPEESTLRTLASELGVSGSVEFWGVRRDISDILQACDVFSLTSLSEAASLTLLEAMANGCPVAITDVGGNPEHVTHGQHGLLSPRGDWEVLAENLRQLVSDPRSAEQMALAARARVTGQFRLSDAIDRYAQLYDALAINR